MPKWIDLGTTADYPENAQVCTTAEKHQVVIIHTRGQLYAIANDCPHAGMPIGEGETRGHVITCPFHGYAYDVRTGRNIDFPYEELPVKTYPVRIQGDRVQIEIPDSEGRAT